MHKIKLKYIYCIKLYLKDDFYKKSKIFKINAQLIKTHSIHYLASKNQSKKHILKQTKQNAVCLDKTPWGHLMKKHY